MTPADSKADAVSSHAPAAVPILARAGRSSIAWLRFLVIVLVVLGVDLGIKHWAFASVAPEPVVLDAHDPSLPLPYHESKVVVPGVLSLHLTTNRGAVFGLGQGRQMLFVLVSLVAAVIIFRTFWVSHRRAWVLHAALAMVLGGALGNLYDRLRFSAVRDMFLLFPDVKLPFGLRWPGEHGSDALYPWIFNFADAALLLGVGVLLVVMWQYDRRRQTAQSAPN